MCACVIILFSYLENLFFFSFSFQSEKIKSMFSLFSHFRIQLLRLTKGKHDVQIYFQAYLLFSLKIKIKIIINK